MAFRLISGSAKIEYYPKTASTAIANGAIVSTTSGFLIPATNATTNHLGICMKTIAATDSDYASQTMIPVVIPSQDAVFEADAASLTTAMVDSLLDLTDSVTVNGAATTHKVVQLVKFISATKGYFKINSPKGYIAGV